MIAELQIAIELLLPLQHLPTGRRIRLSTTELLEIAAGAPPELITGPLQVGILSRILSSSIPRPSDR